jgi:autotransporter-associated beta strand protein
MFMQRKKRLWNLSLAVLSLSVASNASASPTGVAGLSFDDEFSGNALNLGNWNYRAPGVRNSATDVQNAVAVTNGDLTITSYTNAGTNYTGMISTQGLFQQTYGYYEASISFADSPGEWSAFWVQSPTIGNPVTNPVAAGVEMDIVEHRNVNSSNNSVISQYDAALHWNGYGTAEQSALAYVVPPIAPGSWNTYGMLWTPAGYTFYFNGTPEWTQSSPNTPASAASEYIILSSEISNGSWAGTVPANGYGASNTSTTKMSVDYVHAYALANVYTPTNASTDTWTTGGNWNFAPLGGPSTELTFVDTTGTTVLANGLINTSTNDNSNLLQANVIDLGGAGPATGPAALITINSSGPGISLMTDSLSGSNPTVNLAAMHGNAGLLYTINSPIVLANNTLFQGNGSAGFTFTGQISGSGSLTKSGSSTITVSGQNNYSGGTCINAGTVIFASPGALPMFSMLVLNGGSAIAASHGSATNNTLFVSTLSLAGPTNNWTATLDLTNNDLVVRNGSLGTLTAQVRQGFNAANGGNWQGSGGILSSAAAADTTHLTALGVIQNSVNGIPAGPALYTSFDGQTVYSADVLVKYTYYGDANLDGQVDGTDYSRIDNGYLNNFTGWYNGDFNYDGVVNGSDYTLIDNDFNTEGAQLTESIQHANAEIAAAVPEPSLIAWVGIALLRSLGRRVSPSARNNIPSHT